MVVCVLIFFPSVVVCTLPCSCSALNITWIVCKQLWLLQFFISHFILSKISQLPLSLWWSLLPVLQWWVNWATLSAALSVKQTLSAPPSPTAGTMRAVIPGHKLGPPAPTALLVCDHTMLGSIHVRWQLHLHTWMKTSVRVWFRILLCRVSCVTLLNSSHVHTWIKTWKWGMPNNQQEWCTYQLGVHMNGQHCQYLVLSL